MKNTFLTLMFTTITTLSAIGCGYGGFGINCRQYGELTIRDFNETQEKIFIGEVQKVTDRGAHFNVARIFKGEITTESVFVERPTYNPWNLSENLKSFKVGQEWLLFTSSELSENSRMYECSRSSLQGSKKFKEDMAFFDLILSKPNGTTNDFYTKGNLNGTGAFEDGMPHGEWRYYHEDGRLLSITNYDHGIKHGKWSNFNAEGIVTYMQEFDQGVQTLERRFFADGMLEFENVYNADQQHTRSFFPNGQLRYLRKYHSNGNSEFKSYYENGQLRQVSQNVNNQQSGVWRWFDEEGNVTREVDHSAPK